MTDLKKTLGSVLKVKSPYKIKHLISNLGKARCRFFSSKFCIHLRLGVIFGVENDEIKIFWGDKNLRWGKPFFLNRGFSITGQFSLYL